MTTIREAVMAAINDGEKNDAILAEFAGWRYDDWQSHLRPELRAIHQRNEQAANISPDNHADYWRMWSCFHQERWVARHYQGWAE